MHNLPETFFSVDLDFETIRLPPVEDILVLGKKVPQGKYGILHSFQLILPDVFTIIDIDDKAHENVEAVIVNRGILQKLSKEKVLSILTDYVFPYVAKGEAVKVNFNVTLFQRNIKGEIDASEGVPQS